MLHTLLFREKVLIETHFQWSSEGRKIEHFHVPEPSGPVRLPEPALFPGEKHPVLKQFLSLMVLLTENFS